MGRGKNTRRGCWQSMLLIRKAHPLLWDQPSSWFQRGRGATQGVGPGSTNQRQDAIDRHVAPVGPRVVVERVGGELFQGEGGRVVDVEIVGRRRVLHTPLHLLVNRINQRHHGLSPIPPPSGVPSPSLLAGPPRVLRHNLMKPSRHSNSGD